MRLIEDLRYEVKNELTGSGLGEDNVPADSTSQNCEMLELSSMGWIAV